MRYRAPIQSLQLEVDMRQVELIKRDQAVLDLFSALPRGDGFVFIDDRWPSTLLASLQRRYWGEFDWYPLERRPDIFRVALSRRSTQLPPLHRMLEFMMSDHNRVELMLLHLRDLSYRGNWSELGRLCSYMETGLLRHMRMEEEVLFPLILERSGQPPDELEPITEEHQQILQELRLIQASAFDAQAELAPSSSVEREIICLVGSLLRSFFKHEQREHQILYSPVNLTLSQQETDLLVKQLQRMT
jgi:uncharacterized protein (DUF2249 family)